MLGSTGSAASDRSLPVRFMCEFPLACVKIHHLVDGSSFRVFVSFLSGRLGPGVGCGEL